MSVFCSLHIAIFCSQNYLCNILLLCQLMSFKFFFIVQTKINFTKIFFPKNFTKSNLNPILRSPYYSFHKLRTKNFTKTYSKRAF
ncbi:unnamed protein product [Trifolium pratense]|uniref:Uncharacterized protein n=1 Tax=Trifolium pratense TaxID=57577 RepID=A0ACB0KTY2_TRIPR|nr:unnamed protein product [Trifolium pratense]